MRRTLLCSFTVMLSVINAYAQEAPPYRAREATGATVAAIQPVLEAFRTSVGTLNPNTAGSVGTGRREINWDGVNDDVATPYALPGDFFNTSSPRGIVLTSPGRLRVSADDLNPTNALVRFGDVNAQFVTAFATFSTQRLFSPFGSSITDITFFVPGSTTPATTKAFGAIFTDVDLPNSTQIECFDAAGSSIVARYVLPTAGNASLSFLGIEAPARPIARVRITSGSSESGTDITQGGTRDYVAMDDFIFGEPVAATTPPPVLTIGNTTTTEGAAGVDATFTISLSAPSAQPVTVSYATADGSATSPADYQATSGTLTFAPGETTATFTVAVASDTQTEADESFTVTLSNAVYAVIADPTATGTILDADSNATATGVQAPVAGICGAGAAQMSLLSVVGWSVISRGSRRKTNRPPGR